METLQDNNKKIRVMLADDHGILREGVRSILQRDEELEVVDEAGERNEVVEIVATAKPDVLVLDLVMPGLEGLEVFRLVREQSPETKILVFSGYMSDELIVQCLQAGAKGYLAKTAKSSDLVGAIKVVNSGGVWAEQRVMAKALDKSPTVTKRELDIIRLVSEGLRNKEIADKLGISEKTVKAHMHSVFKKLNVEHRLQVALYSLGIKPGPDNKKPQE
jgi:two-component system nitrate/nitrite response regulator NarL